MVDIWKGGGTSIALVPLLAISVVRFTSRFLMMIVVCVVLEVGARGLQMDLRPASSWVV